jgi:predicted enzyme related to lactoylglutathione lyase
LGCALGCACGFTLGYIPAPLCGLGNRASLESVRKENFVRKKAEKARSKWSTREQTKEANYGTKEETTMKIKLNSVLVDDQDKALKFYTQVLGFVKKREIPVGEFKWLTVVSPDEPDGTELALEPNENPAAKTFQKAIFDQGIPLTAFAVEDIQKEYERMGKLGVAFSTKPTKTPGPTIAVFNDTCGNLIQIYQV